MNEEQQNKLKQYAYLKNQISSLEGELEAIKSDCICAIEQSGVSEIAIDGVGKMVLGETRTWKYTEETEEVGKRYKALKKTEEQKGLAEFTVKPRLAFFGLKEKVIEE